MTAMTNAPTLPDIPFEWNVWEGIPTQTVRKSDHDAIATTLRDQLAEAQRENERLNGDIARWLESEPNRALRLEETGNG